MTTGGTRLTYFERAEARWYLGALWAVELQRAAWDAQATGHDGPALREQAAYEWSLFAGLDDLVARALAETGRPSLTRAEALRRLARDEAAGIVAGEVDPFDGAAELHRLWLEGESSSALSVFVYLLDLAEIDRLPEQRRAWPPRSGRRRRTSCAVNRLTPGTGPSRVRTVTNRLVRRSIVLAVNIDKPERPGVGKLGNRS